MYLYADAADKLLLIDSQQRLRTVAHFFEGFFGHEAKGRRPVFRLTGLNEESPFAGKTYAELRAEAPQSFSRLNDAVLRSFVIKQLNPQDHTSVLTAKGPIAASPGHIIPEDEKEGRPSPPMRSVPS
jgi:hypothetical protein